MSFKLSSNKLLESLESVSRRFSGRSIGAKLSVSDEASWWYYHEFGTATHQGEEAFDTPPSVAISEPEGTFNTSGYPILPKNGEAIRLPGTAQYPEPLLVPQVGSEFTLEHPGVPALGLVRTVLENVHTAAASGIVNALQKGEFEVQIVQSDLTEIVMPEVLELIVESISDKMGHHTDRDTPGKLGGRSPSEVFRGAAIISANEEE